MYNIKYVNKETIKIHGKSVNTVVKMLKRRGYGTIDWEDHTMEAFSHHAGVCIEKATATFSPKGRALTDLVITEPVIVNY